MTLGRKNPTARDLKRLMTPDLQNRLTSELRGQPALDRKRRTT